MLGQKTVMLFQWIQECCFPSETGVSGLACRGKGHVSSSVSRSDQSDDEEGHDEELI